MTNLPDPIKRLADELSELPSIGPRQAVRLIFYLINQGQNTIQGLAQGFQDLKRIKTCSRCFFPTLESGLRPPAGVGVARQNERNLCDICADAKRKQNVIAIVEKETDLLSIENTKKFNGRYLILGPISKTGILEDWQKLRLQNLKQYVQKELGGMAEEIILAFNPTSNGDFNASFISHELKPITKKISRLGRGLPTGGEIEFADDETLGSSLEQRK